jgi:hypothetical protein
MQKIDYWMQHDEYQKRNGCMSFKEISSLTVEDITMMNDDTTTAIMNTSLEEEEEEEEEEDLVFYCYCQTLWTNFNNDKKEIMIVSKTKEGKIHDFAQLKKSGLIDHIPPDITLWVDKGYQGITKCIKRNNAVMIPYKKCKGKALTAQQKLYNKIISGIRIVVEHAIGGIKRFASMSNLYRNKVGQDDQMIYLCASLWNFHLQYKDC